MVSGKFPPQFVGLTRGGYGNPFAVHTQSGQPLAADMTQAMCSALQKKGFQCVPVLVAASESADEVRRKLRETPGSLALLFTFSEWKSDTYVGTALIYNATLQVLDSRGTMLAERHIEGRDVLGSNAWNPATVVYTAVPQTFKQKIEELLNHPEVVAAFRTAQQH